MTAPDAQLQRRHQGEDGLLARVGARALLGLAPLGAVLHGGSRLVLRTARVTEHHEAATPTPAIFVNWHRHLPLLMPHHGARGRCILMSGSPRMAPIADWARRSGLRLVRGASGEGGREALPTLAEALRAGQSVVLAVDGPAGPAFRARPGCVDLALLSGAPIVPVAYAAAPALTVPGRWDRMLLVAPFGRAEIRYGQPLRVTSEAERLPTLERVQGALERLEAARHLDSQGRTGS